MMMLLMPVANYAAHRRVSHATVLAWIDAGLPTTTRNGERFVIVTEADIWVDARDAGA